MTSYFCVTPNASRQPEKRDVALLFETTGAVSASALTPQSESWQNGFCLGKTRAITATSPVKSSTRSRLFSVRAALPLLVLPFLTTFRPALSAPENSITNANTPHQSANIADLAPAKNADTKNADAKISEAKNDSTAKQNRAPAAVTPNENTTANAVSSALDANITKAPISAAQNLDVPTSAASSADNSSVLALANFNVLLLPLDDVFAASDGATASGASGGISATSGLNAAGVAASLTAGSDAARVVGPAEAAAAPLRRALLRRGLNDVLMAPPDGAVLRRAIAENRIAPDVLDKLRDALKNASAVLVANDDSNVGAPAIAAAISPKNAENTVSKSTTASSAVSNEKTPGENPASAPAITPPTPPPVSPLAISPLPISPLMVTRSAQIASSDDTTAIAISNATRQATRIGQALNYRVVVTLALAPPAANGKTRYVMLLTDTLRESSDFFSFETDTSSTRSLPVSGSASANSASANLTTPVNGRRALYEAGATIGSALLQQKMTVWAQSPAADRGKLSDDALAAARLALAQGQNDAAREALGRVLALNPNQRDALLLLGDFQVQNGDAENSISTYRRALSAGTDAAANANNGAVWTQIAVAYATLSKWPDTLDAGAKALATGADSTPLRVAMATAQLGRAQLFNDAGRSESAADALDEANTHLMRAQQMSPADSAVSLLMAKLFTLQNRSREAAQILDRVAPQMLLDRDFQVAYATSLSERSGREADAFAAWIRATQLTEANAPANASANAPANASANAPISSTRSALPNVDRARYRRLIEGYDQTASKMVTRAFNLTTAVINGNVSREVAMAQITPMTTDIATANAILKSLTPPDDRSRLALETRLQIGDTLAQSLTAYQMFVENSDDNLRDRAIELHKSALTQLNALRAG